MGEIFYRIFLFFNKHKFIFAAFVLISFLISLYLATNLKFEENISQLLPDYKNMDKLSLVYQNQNISEKIIVNISELKRHDSSTDKLEVFGDKFTFLLQRRLQHHIKEIKYKIDAGFFNELYSLFLDNLPLYIDSSDYQTIDSLSKSDAVTDKIDEAYRILTTPVGSSVAPFLLKDPLGMTFLAMRRMDKILELEDYKLINSRIYTADSKNLILFISSSHASNETSANSELIDGIDDIVSELKQSYPNIDVHYFGLIPMSVSNAKQLKSDIIMTVMLSLSGILLFNFLAFRSIKVALLAFLPAFYGSAISLCILYLIKPNISAIALGIGSVILGIIVDYSLYIISHYQKTKSVEKVIKEMTFPIIICSLTTVASFLTLLFVKSRVLYDLGLFAGFSLLGAAFFAIAILPHLIKNLPSEKPDFRFIRFISEYSFEKNRYISTTIILLVFISLFFVGKVAFQPDLSSMNYVSEKMRIADEKINKVDGNKIKKVFAITFGNNLQDALQKNELLSTKLGNLKQSWKLINYSNISNLIISESLQISRIDSWKNYWSGDKSANLIRDINNNAANLKFKEDAFSNFYLLLKKNYAPIDFKPVIKSNIAGVGEKIAFVQDKVMITTIIKVDSSMKNYLIDEFQNDKHNLIFDKQLITKTMVSEIENDFKTLVNFSLIAVTIILIFSFGRIETGLIASIPMFLSWIITLGFMGAFRQSFNIFNIIISTFIFGLGVDYSVLMTRGLLQRYKTGKDELYSYRKSILASGVTTIIGIGVLAFAGHPSLNSIYLISIVGMLSVMLISYSIIPILINQLFMHRSHKRFLPMTMLNFIATALSYLVFTIGSCVGAIGGILIFGIWRTNSSYSARKRIFHKLVQILTLIGYRINIHIPKNMHNFRKDVFNKPRLLISNHQSHVDILLLLSLSPKIIMLTNDWVWNSPVFGRIVKFLDFYPVSLGFSNSFEKLSKLTAEGYSIMIFPEGTRSSDFKLGRFHKGAFMIAHELKLDIMPVLLHGTGRCVNKGEILLRRAPIDVEILPEITYPEYSKNPDYQATTKQISSHFRNEYKRFSEIIEGPGYFRDYVIKNYIYKGPILEWYIRVKLKLENNYSEFDKLIPKHGKILDIGCSFGSMSLMLSLLSEDRIITAIDNDAKKIEIASNLHNIPSNLQFICADANDFIFDKYNAIIISDILHYNPPELQEAIVDKCLNSLGEFGIIAIRDSVSDLTRRHRVSGITEFFSTKFGFNKLDSRNLHYRTKKEIESMFDNKVFNVRILDNSRFTSNLTFVISKKEN